MPKISYLISTYNAGDYLDRCIRDLQNQTMRDFAIIIINPASPDKDDEVARRWLDNDDRVHYLYQDEREPYGQSWLRGWKYAYEELDSKYVCNANTDDLRHPRCGELLYGGIEAAGDKIAFAYPGIDVYDEAGRFVTGGERAPFDREVFKRECHGGPNVLWRSSLLKEISWDIAWNRAKIITSAFDYWLWLKFMSLGYDGLAVSGRLVRYTQRPGSIEHLAGMSSVWQSLCCIAEFFPETLSSIDADDFAEWPFVPECESWCEAAAEKKKWYGTKVKVFLTEKDLE